MDGKTDCKRCYFSGTKNQNRRSEMIEKSFRKMAKPNDTIVITGDHSWGRNLEECARDFEFIEALPGRKILLCGNRSIPTVTAEPDLMIVSKGM